MIPHPRQPVDGSFLIWGLGTSLVRGFGWPTALNNRRMPFLVETTLHQVVDGLCLFSRFFLEVETTFDYIWGG